MDKYRATRLQLEGDPSLAGILEIREAPQVSMEEILLVHDKDYAEVVHPCSADPCPCIVGGWRVEGGSSSPPNLIILRVPSLIEP